MYKQNAKGSGKTMTIALSSSRDGINLSRTRIVQGSFDRVKMGGILPQLSRMPAELFVEKFEAAENERAVAIAGFGYLIYT